MSTDVKGDWREARAGCGRKMPRVCKQAYTDFRVHLFLKNERLIEKKEREYAAQTITS